MHASPAASLTFAQASPLHKPRICTSLTCAANLTCLLTPSPNPSPNPSPSPNPNPNPNPDPNPNPSPNPTSQTCSVPLAPASLTGLTCFTRPCAVHDHSARPRAPQTHATPSPSIYNPRPRQVHPLLPRAQSSSVVGEKHAQTKPRREKHAQNLQALSLSPPKSRPTQASSLAPSSPLSAPLIACGLRRR